MSTLAIRPGTADHVMSRLFPKPSPYLHDPNGWIEARTGEKPWSMQRVINDSIANNRYTAVKSCHDTGKSWDMSRIACWWLDVHPVGQAFVVTTAPTWAQVQAILWREIGKAHDLVEERAKRDPTGTLKPLPGRTTLDCQWYIGRELVAYGRKPADTNQAAFQGIHALYVLIIIDEGCGVVKALYEAADALATNQDARVVAVGNPDDPSSYFAEVCKPGSGWVTHQISAYDTPNFTGEQVSDHVSRSLISPVWVEERRKRWGESSPVFISKVLGEFPEDSDDGVVPGSWAFRCHNVPSGDTAKTPNEAGLDCGAGGDESVMTQRLGKRLIPVFSDQNPDTMATADKVHAHMIRLGCKRIKVDVIGIGKGISDQLRRLGKGKYEVVPVNVGESSSQPDRFPRLRDEVWWTIGRELSETGDWDLSAMSEDFIAQLTSPKYSIVPGSRKIKVEAKEETRKRLGSSPDHADSGLLAFYDGRPKQRWRMV